MSFPTSVRFAELTRFAKLTKLRAAAPAVSPARLRQLSASSTLFPKKRLTLPASETKSSRIFITTELSKIRLTSLLWKNATSIFATIFSLVWTMELYIWKTGRAGAKNQSKNYLNPLMKNAASPCLASFMPLASVRLAPQRHCCWPKTMEHSVILCTICRKKKPPNL